MLRRVQQWYKLQNDIQDWCHTTEFDLVKLRQALRSWKLLYSVRPHVVGRMFLGTYTPSPCDVPTHPCFVFFVLFAFHVCISPGGGVRTAAQTATRTLSVHCTTNNKNVNIDPTLYRPLSILDVFLRKKNNWGTLSILDVFLKVKKNNWSTLFHIWRFLKK